MSRIQECVCVCDCVCVCVCVCVCLCLCLCLCVSVSVSAQFHSSTSSCTSLSVHMSLSVSKCISVSISESVSVFFPGTDLDDLSQILPEVPTLPPPQLVEEMIATIKTIVVKIEASSGRRFVPMLILEASMHAIVKDWSSRVSQFSYFHFILTLST